MVTDVMREASAADADAVARLHADSWRRHYRGALSDDFLDGDVLEDRRSVWSGRLAAPPDGWFTVVIEREGALIGFAHTRLDEDPRWGSLLDNLHVASAVKRQGIGSVLMAETARLLAERRPSGGLYLWVLEQNTAAQAFYAARGGRRVERMMRGPQPDGGSVPAFRFVWPDPAVLQR